MVLQEAAAALAPARAAAELAALQQGRSGEAARVDTALDCFPLLASLYRTAEC